MHKFNVLATISILLISTINSPILFSSIALPQEGSNVTTPTQNQTTPPSPTTTEPPKTETTTTTVTEPVKTCPVPPQAPVCRENQGLVTNFDDKGCVTGYECKEIPKTEIGRVALCPAVSPPTITCRIDEQLSKITDDKGCVIGYNCISTAPEVSVCPEVPGKPPCDGSLAPIFEKGCLIYYTCVPQGCRQETDASGFIRVACEQEKVCTGDEQQAKLKSQCFAQGGNPVPFQDPSGCTFYDCRFDNRGINPNPIGGHQSCPTPEEIHNEARLCKEAGVTPGIAFEGGCKIVKCSQETGPVCRYMPDSEKEKIFNECSSRGLEVERVTDKNGCTLYKCTAVQESACPRDIPPEAYKNCDANGGEMIVKTDREGCIVFSQCIAPGDKKHAYVKPVEEVPDATVLLNLALKLEQLKIVLQKLATESKEIAKYYASTGSLDEERYNRVSVMFDDAAGRIDEIKTTIRDDIDSLTTDDLEEIRHDIKYIKEVTLKDILYLMLSNSDDVKETLETSKKVSGKRLSAEELERNVKSCGTDGYCFDKAIRSCKPVSFQPEGRRGPSLTIKGLQDDKCVLHVIMQSDDMVPPGYTRDTFYMECPIPNYALGVRGPEDVIPNCEGPMAKFAKQFGGAADVNGGGDAFQEILEKEGGPGGCETERECATYCLDNYDECRQWVKEHPAVGTMPSREELRRYASGEDIEKREEFREKGGVRGFSGPGGCKGPQECDRFCRSNPEECMRWCDENPDICPRHEEREFEEEFRRPREFRRGPEEFERGGAAQPVSREPVQVCVGCLNNGICDIGECSECVDCLKGGRTITGEISRAR